MNELATNIVPVNPDVASHEELDAYAKSAYEATRAMAQKTAEPLKISYTSTVISTGIGAALTAVAFSKVSKVTKWLAGTGAVLSGLAAAVSIAGNRLKPQLNIDNKKETDEIIALVNKVEGDKALHDEFVNYLSKNIPGGIKKDDLDKTEMAIPPLLMFGLDKGLISGENQYVGQVVAAYALMSHENLLVRKAATLVSNTMTR